MENQNDLNNQNNQQGEQAPPSQSSDSVFEKSKPKVHYWIALVTISFIVLLGIAAFALAGQGQPRSIPDDETAIGPSPASMASDDEVTISVGKWPEVNLTDTVIFVGSKYSLNLSTAMGGDLRPFNDEIAQNYGGIGSTQISSDNNKLLFTTSDDSGNSVHFVASLDGTVLERIDMARIQSNFAEQYEVTIWGWSLDPNKLVLHARDMQNFLDDQCCHGGDFRASEQIVASFDINTYEVDEIFSITAPPILIALYDPADNVFVYSAYEGWYVVDLDSLEETAVDDFGIAYLSYTGGEVYSVKFEDKRNLSIYSVHETATLVTSVTLDEPEDAYYGDKVIWSPNHENFAIKASGPRGLRLKVYDMEGTLVSDTHSSDYARVVFSNDSRYLLSMSSIELSEGDYSHLWWTIDIATGELQQGERFSSPDLVGELIYWFK